MSLAMFGLPADFDTSFLLDKEVESICFAKYQINVYLEARIWIQIEGPFSHFQNGRLVQDVTTFPLAESTVIHAIGQKVVKTECSQTGDIQLWLSEGDQLLIRADNGPYESYRIYDGKREIIV
jgi:hypothetical protein